MRAIELSRLNLSEIQADVFQVAKSKGFWDDCIVEDTNTVNVLLAEASIPEKNALIHTEITEAFEDYLAGRMETTLRAKGGKPVGFPTEVADVCIRVLDLAGAAEFDIEKALKHIDVGDSIGRLDEKEQDVFIPFALLRMHQCASAALESYRERKMSLVIGKDGAAEDCIVTDLARLVRTCFVLAHRLGIDLDAEILVKHNYNKSRDFKHGNKRC
jgi:hypothetical protein